jgi:hypothetical protein
VHCTFLQHPLTLWKFLLTLKVEEEEEGDMEVAAEAAGKFRLSV